MSFTKYLPCTHHTTVRYQTTFLLLKSSGHRPLVPHISIYNHLVKYLVSFHRYNSLMGAKKRNSESIDYWTGCPRLRFMVRPCLCLPFLGRSFQRNSADSC
ncbi:hypothetical protein CEXT_692821 [Caerostris extrusa]|uniref:Uncharacterized protein n=1 Tax=Caerostris extrusa TaxID=172846 RepID=A0AAV4NZ28_CAEEX|nr:hypothetical protein CEXT_692821 [Caerostris extrusa]